MSKFIFVLSNLKSHIPATSNTSSQNSDWYPLMMACSLDLLAVIQFWELYKWLKVIDLHLGIQCFRDWCNRSPVSRGHHPIYYLHDCHRHKTLCLCDHLTIYSVEWSETQPRFRRFGPIKSDQQHENGWDSWSIFTELRHSDGYFVYVRSGPVAGVTLISTVKVLIRWGGSSIIDIPQMPKAHEGKRFYSTRKTSRVRVKCIHRVRSCRSPWAHHHYAIISECLCRANRHSECLEFFFLLRNSDNTSTLNESAPMQSLSSISIEMLTYIPRWF